MQKRQRIEMTSAESLAGASGERQVARDALVDAFGSTAIPALLSLILQYVGYCPQLQCQAELLFPTCFHCLDRLNLELLDLSELRPAAHSVVFNCEMVHSRQMLEHDPESGRILVELDEYRRHCGLDGILVDRGNPARLLLHVPDGLDVKYDETRLRWCPIQEMRFEVQPDGREERKWVQLPDELCELDSSLKLNPTTRHYWYSRNRSSGRRNCKLHSQLQTSHAICTTSH